MLWHYRSFDTAERHILKHGGQVQLRAFLTMRDPRESKEWVPVIPAAGGTIRRSELRAQLAGPIDDLRRRAKIISLTLDDPKSDDVFRRGYARPRLWEMYGNRATGNQQDYRAVCLGFDGEVLINSITADLISQGVPRADILAHEIDYLDKPLEFEVSEADIAAYTPVGAVERCFRRGWRSLFFQKLCDWETEYEFRILAMTNDATNNPIRVGFGSALRAVYTRNLVEAEENRLATAVQASFPSVPLHALDWVNNSPNPREIWPDR